MDATRLKSLYLRFISHTYPGETIVIRVWKIAEGHIYLELSTLERKIITCIGDVTYV